MPRTWENSSRYLHVLISLTLTWSLFGSCTATNFSLNIRISDITAQVLSDDINNSITPKIFGPPRDFFVAAEILKPGVHPRIVFSKQSWEDAINCYAEQRYIKDTWSKTFLDYTLDKGPENSMLEFYANLNTSAYTGKMGMNKSELFKLAQEMNNMTEYHEGGIFMFTLHSIVHENMMARGMKPYLSKGKNIAKVMRIVVNYAKVVLSHYFTYGCPICTYEEGMRKSDLWDKKKSWMLNNDWHTAGLAIALSYDVLYDRFSVEEKRTIRSAIAVMVKDREHWGITKNSDRGSPNAMLHPHRIFSNWATYHANLFVTNTAIEGETDFDDMVKSVNASYDKRIDTKVKALIRAFMSHSIYPDGSTFEDGYLYNLGMREATLLFLALARRGHNHLHTNRFRNFVYFGGQMMEPFHCGDFIGHSSGGGQLYPTWQGLVRYAYPKGEFTSMLWQQRVGLNFKNGNPCRTIWHQTMMQMAIIGGEHARIIPATSYQGVSKITQRQIGMALYATRRGLLIAKSSIAETALYAHFDARPDAFFPGHDNSDRGIFTLTALQRNWITDFSWHYYESQYHTLLHIDGKAQARKAPSVRMKKVKDFPQAVIASADLSYAYNVQWVRAFAYTRRPWRFEYVFENNTRVRKVFVFNEKETVHPRYLGWPQDDPAYDIGFRDNSSLWGEYNVGFSGLFNWKRKYREDPVEYYVRSFGLIRLQGNTSYLFIGDNIGMLDDEIHTFESYLIFAKNVQPNMEKSVCEQNHCKIIVNGGYRMHLDIHVSTNSGFLSFRFDTIKTYYTRLILKSTARKKEQFCMILHPNTGGYQDFALKRHGEHCLVITSNEARCFKFKQNEKSIVISEENDEEFDECPTAIEEYNNPVEETPSPSEEAELIPSPSQEANLYPSPSNELLV